MYKIKDVAMMMGLTDRTLRNYLKAGILQGTKEDGAWCFSEEQIDCFLQNNDVKAVLQAKKNGIVYDFMANRWKKDNNACIILDLPEENGEKTSNYICAEVNKREGMRMSFENEKGKIRVILSGKEEDVLEIWRKRFDS